MVPGTCTLTYQGNEMVICSYQVNKTCRAFRSPKNRQIGVVALTMCFVKTLTDLAQLILQVGGKAGSKRLDDRVANSIDTIVGSACEISKYDTVPLAVRLPPKRATGQPLRRRPNARNGGCKDGRTYGGKPLRSSSVSKRIQLNIFM